MLPVLPCRGWAPWMLWVFPSSSSWLWEALSTLLQFPEGITALSYHPEFFESAKQGGWMADKVGMGLKVDLSVRGQVS